MDLDSLDWAELKTFLAVARAGTILGGARSLGLSHSTVLRRLDSLEARLETRLLTRHPRGCSLTVSGEAAFSELEEVQRRMQTLERRVVGRDQSLRGNLKITVLEGALAFVLPVLADLRAQHPALCFELLLSDTYLDLLRGEADLAVRLTNHPPPELVGRRHGKVAMAVYAHRKLLSALGEDSDTLDPRAYGPWAVMGEERREVPQAVWERAHVPPDKVWLRASSGSVVHRAVSRGSAFGVVPCAVADLDENLVRIGDPIEALASELWTLYHRDLRRAARLRTVHDKLSEHITHLRPLIEGELVDTREARVCFEHRAHT